MSSTQKTTTKMTLSASSHPQTLGDLMIVAATKSDYLSSRQSTKPLRNTVLQNRFVSVINAMLEWCPLQTEINELDTTFIKSPLVTRPNHVASDAREPSSKRAPVADFATHDEQASEDLSEQASEDLSEQASSEFTVYETLQHLQSDELYEDPSGEFPIIGEDNTHAEFPDDDTMAAAFDNVHMLEPFDGAFDGAYMLPTQPGFDMSAPSQSTVEYDFDGVAVLNPEDEQALAEQLDDQLFEKYMLALIQANGILHAMDGTIPSMEEFFGLQDLVNRVFANTAAEADKRYVAYLLSVVSETTNER